MNEEDDPQPTTGGVNLSNVRQHNARAILSLLRERGALSGAELARALGVSAQTASVILRALSADGLIVRGAPIKGKVGKPQTPFALDKDGAFGFGLRLGRRSAELVLMDFLGTIRARVETSYAYPTPAVLEAFLATEQPRLLDEAGLTTPLRVAGLGVALPFEIWNWLDALGAPKAEAEAWRDYPLRERLASVTGLDVLVANDVNLACNAELIEGANRDLRNFAYFYIGAFAGGAVVLNGQVQHGPRGNAGAFGSIPVRAPGSGGQQLIHMASLYSLERDIAAATGAPVNLRRTPELFVSHAALCAAWRRDAAIGLARAIAAVVAVLDVGHVVLDGAFPAQMRSALTRETDAALAEIDRTGLNPISLSEGTLGQSAGAMGAAYAPLLHAHFSVPAAFL